MNEQNQALVFLEEEMQLGVDGISRHIKANPPYMMLLSLVRELDVQLAIPSQTDGSPSVAELYKYGWPVLCREAYRLLDMEPQPMMFPSDKEQIGDAQWLLSFSGRVGLSQQYLDYLRYNILRVAEIEGRTVRFELRHEYSGVERFDMEYTRLVTEHVIEGIIEEREARRPIPFEDVQPLMRETVRMPHPQFMAYEAPEAVWEYFQRHGRYHLLRLQEHENFGPDDLFGGLPYSKYVDAIEWLMGVGLMHTNYALAAMEQNPEALLANLLPYLKPDESFTSGLVADIDVTEEQARQIVACLTLDMTNYVGYASFTAAAPPPFIRMSRGYLLRSVAGCLGNPFQLLNYELKRRYEKDYFRAVNNREVRFRDDLFRFFPQQHIVKLGRGVRLNTKQGLTDIDAVLYDRKAGTVALIQLKWPDGFGDSMRRRESAMTNYYKKANEWVRKIHSWVGESNAKTIFSALQIKVTPEERANFKGFYIIVMNRYTAHFTSGEPDENAAWGSWAQFVATFATGMKHKPDDPLGAAYSCLRYFEPRRRMDREGIPPMATFDMKIGTSRIIVSNDKGAA